MIFSKWLCTALTIFSELSPIIIYALNTLLGLRKRMCVVIPTISERRVGRQERYSERQIVLYSKFCWKILARMLWFNIKRTPQYLVGLMRTFVPQWLWEMTRVIFQLFETTKKKTNGQKAEARLGRFLRSSQTAYIRLNDGYCQGCRNSSVNVLKALVAVTAMSSAAIIEPIANCSSLQFRLCRTQNSTKA